MSGTFAHGLSLHVSVSINATDLPTFFNAFTPVYKKVIAEPKCLFFELYQDPVNPGNITWVEDWAGNPDWFMSEQITKDYYTDYLATTEPMFLKPRDGFFVERKGGIYFYNGANKKHQYRDAEFITVTRS
ncbi:hypothetical protein GGS20DRAFT_591054 [Poronia punctata]|nr:hypothetical protein GGS20DRAFT_591054 [Poronia punctata]